MFNGLYRATMALSGGPRAPLALALVAFAESSFFPLPPDLLLVPMALARPRRAWVYAGIATLASVAGGVLGYAIGALLYETVGQWLIHAYGYDVSRSGSGDVSPLEKMRAFYAHWGALLILVKGLTPIPFKLVTIVSGLLGYNLLYFVLLSLLTRGARFFIVAGLLSRYGASISPVLERFFPWFLAILALIVVGGFVLAAHVL